MRLRQASKLETIRATIADGSSEVLNRPATLEPWDFSSPGREEVLALLKSDDYRKRTAWLAVGALVMGLALGWAGALSWYAPATTSVLNAISQRDAPSRQVAETKLGKAEGTRKTASTSILRTPLPASQVSAAGSSISAKPQARWSDGTHSMDVSSTSPPVDQADVTGSIDLRATVTPAPDTRPTTIEGWTLLDVRGGTAVLAGPDGVRMAMRGNTVPGVGRIDSIVRWGNRWIVATDSGLIAAP